VVTSGKSTAGDVDTGGKFATCVNPPSVTPFQTFALHDQGDIGGRFAAGVKEAGGDLPLVSNDKHYHVVFAYTLN
jgi:hypothetical protein